MFRSPVVLFTWLQGATFYCDLHARAVSLLPAGEGREWLDFGTGPGLVARLAAARGYRAVGIDSDARMIRAAQRLARCLGSPARFRTGSVFDARPESAHVVSACSLLAVVPDKERAVHALWSTVQPGGTLLIVEPTDRMEPANAASAIESGLPAKRILGLRLWAAARAGRAVPPSTWDSLPAASKSRVDLLAGLVTAWCLHKGVA